MNTSRQELRDFIADENKSHAVVIWSKSYCPFCQATKELFSSYGTDVAVHEIDQHPNGFLLQQELAALTNQRTVPNVFVANTHIGGNDHTQQAHRSGALQKLIAAN